ncbi:unnamed protein product [Effrenium voratum]|uniref:ZZ-type domain-containing protein n=1 Tax=Effrenium voratum TaxID=2562239 RepID=A0AA36NI59_9DINO|nr:unnamed protein product [Effrenium voratum]
MATTVVKVHCANGEIYRLTLSEEPSFPAILKLVSKGCPDAKLGEGGAFLKYEDDEGDSCTLAESTFADFLELQKSKNSRVLKLKVELPKAKDSEQPEAKRREVAEADPPSANAPPVAAGPQGPPPGLEEASDCGPGAWGPPCFEQRISGSSFFAGPGGNGGGPKRLLNALRMLQVEQLLTEPMFASLAVQWLPLLTQRVARKVDKINHMARDGLSRKVKDVLRGLQEKAAATPGLEPYAKQIAEGLAGNHRLGEAMLEMLKALRGLSFEVQTGFCERLAESLLPNLEELAKLVTGDECPGYVGWQPDTGVQCQNCKNPIAGPRFTCSACPSYDLCGNCYPQKNQLHGECPGCRKDFQCTIFPGKGKGKGCEKREKGCDRKGMGKGPRQRFCQGGWPLFLNHMNSMENLWKSQIGGIPSPFDPIPSALFNALGVAEGQDCTWPFPKGFGKGCQSVSSSNELGQESQSEKQAASLRETLQNVPKEQQDLVLDTLRGVQLPISGWP